MRPMAEGHVPQEEDRRGPKHRRRKRIRLEALNDSRRSGWSATKCLQVTSGVNLSGGCGVIGVEFCGVGWLLRGYRGVVAAMSRKGLLLLDQYWSVLKTINK